MRPPRRRGLSAVVLALALLTTAGCATPGRLRTLDRERRGIVLVLSGIEGPSPFNRNIMIGLDEGGCRYYIDRHDWTYNLPMPVLNLANLERNRREARKLANRIVRYRDKYPGRPVYLIGHSAGAGIAILALEALPAGRQVDMAILLAPAISPEYDLSKALRRTRRGICNFYSNRDVGLLMLGTTVFGSVDREHGASAGAVGFRVPTDLSDAERQIYAERLRQVGWDQRLRELGASGTHMGWTSREFAREYLAPMIMHDQAPRTPPAASQPAEALPVGK